MSTLFYVLAPLFAEYIFVGSIFNEKFLLHFSQLKEFHTSKTKKVLLHTLIVVVLTFFYGLIFHLHDIQHLGTYYFQEGSVIELSDSSFGRQALEGTLKIAQAFLDVFLVTSVVFIAAIEVHLGMQFRTAKMQLHTIISSGQINQGDVFAKWRHNHQEICDLAVEFNEHLKFYLGYVVLVSGVKIMVVLYTGTVLCDMSIIVVNVLLVMTILFVMCPAAATSKQVRIL